MPFDTTSAADYQSAVLAGRVTPVTAHLPNAAAALQGMFERWLAADRGQRPPGAAVLLADLERVVDAAASG